MIDAVGEETLVYKDVATIPRNRLLLLLDISSTTIILHSFLTTFKTNNPSSFIFTMQFSTFVSLAIAMAASAEAAGNLFEPRACIADGGKFPVCSDCAVL